MGLRAFVACALVVLGMGCAGCSLGGGGGGGGGEAAGGAAVDDAARAFSRAIDDTPVDTPFSAQARAKAKVATCSALEGYSSEPAGGLTDLLKAEADRQQLRSDLGLTEADPGLMQRLIDAADEIEGSQQASEVVSALGC